MENYYEHLELDMTSSLDKINEAIEKMSSAENADMQKLREIKSILLNETARKMYDEKLINHILNKKKQGNPFPPLTFTNPLTLDNTVLHDKFIFGAVALFLLSILSDFIFGLNVNLVINFLVMALMLVLFYMDWKLLGAHEKATFSKWWILFSPVYIYKRGKAADRGNLLFLIWMAITVLYFVVKVAFNTGTAILERSACETVTNIYHSQFRQYSTSCKKVTITESQGKMHYGFAEISDGTTRDIIVTEQENGTIYVRITQ